VRQEGQPGRMSGLVGAGADGQTEDDKVAARRLALARARAKRAAAKAPSTPEEIEKARLRAEKRAQRLAQRTMPKDIEHNAALDKAIAEQLPSNYSFEIKKTLWRIRKEKATTVALQFPEGLLMYSCIIADILEEFGGVGDVLIMGDVTYGACCVDDYSAQALGAQLLVHYGHSCLVPINKTNIPVQYVFVDIAIDVRHLVDCVGLTFPDRSTRLALMGTIQFASAMNTALGLLQKEKQFANVTIPQCKPLSRGEVLGCTSPVLENVDAFVFVADGRFHLESAMIHNPSTPAYQYNPYSKTMTIETYDTDRMRSVREGAIQTARDGKCWGVILGTLGRQGSETILNNICRKLQAHGKKYFVLLLSEIFPAKLALFQDTVDVWVQIACPRLSIDWGYAFKAAPLLNPYEANVVLGTAPWKSVYPMDFYANGSGPWTNYHVKD
jgi:2-(3-amino-3-carboxypropyl)histidine synthase